MRMVLRVGRCPFLSFESRVHDEAASGGIGGRNPHAEGLQSMSQRRGELVAAINDFQCGDLPIGKTCRGRGVGRIRIGVIGTPFGGPRIASRRPLAQVEDRAASHVVIDDAIGESVKLVALPDELRANRFRLRRRNPIGRWLFLDADQLGTKHERGEADNRNVGRNAVVVGRIALRHGQRLASALRAADVIVIDRASAIETLHENHCGVVGLLHLHVAEVLYGFVAECPVVTRWCTRGGCPARPRTEAALLVSGIASVGREPELQQIRCFTGGQVGNRAVHPTASKLHRMPRPGSRKHDTKIDGASVRTLVDWGHRAIDGAIRGSGTSSGHPPGRGKRNSGDRFTDRGNRNLCS